MQLNKKVVRLSYNNKLSRLVDGIYGARKYKIIKEYIMVFADSEIILSNNIHATIDERDALHIAHNAGKKKVAAISNMRKLIQHSICVAFEESTNGKYDLFLYYETKVKLDKEQYCVYINVGRTRNNQGYKIYDLTIKLRESAHRIYDVERLSKSIALKTDSLIASITSEKQKNK